MAHAKPWPSCTIEGPARILSEGIGDATTDILAKILGSPPDPAPSDGQLAERGRVILEIDITRVYGVSYIGD
jgi:hypothetical protein